MHYMSAELRHTDGSIPSRIRDVPCDPGTWRDLWRPQPPLAIEGRGRFYLDTGRSEGGFRIYSEGLGLWVWEPWD